MIHTSSATVVARIVSATIPTSCDAVRVLAHDASFQELLALAQIELGEEAVLELEHEVVVAGSCQQCGHEQAIRRPVDALHAGTGLCPECCEPVATRVRAHDRRRFTITDCELERPGPAVC